MESASLWETIAKRFELVINAMTLLIVALIGVFGWIAASKIFGVFRSDTTFDHYVWSRIEGASENDQLVTGLSAVDMLWLKHDDQWYSLADVLRRDIPQDLDRAVYGVPDNSDAEDDPEGYRERKRRRIREEEPALTDFSYCAHSYELVLGYESFSDLRAELESAAASNDEIRIRPPKILALDIAKSRVHPPAETDACMRRNGVAEARQDTEADIWSILEYDGIKEMHIKQGQLTAATLIDSITGACIATPDSEDDGDVEQDSTGGGSDRICWRDKLIEQWKADESEAGEAGDTDLSFGIFSFGTPGERAERLALSADAAGMGALQVTISTLFGMDTSWRPWYWFDREGIYLQRDITRIVYGSPVAPLAALEPRRVLGEDVTRMIMRTPTELSRDRQNNFALQTGKDVVWEKVAENAVEQNLAAYVTARINASVSEAELSIRERAVFAAEALIRRRILGWSDGNISVEFRDGSGNDAGLDLLTSISTIEQSR